MRKSPGVACRHLVPGGGCGIHDTRPPVCREYHCAWRFMAELDETWRPDLSGVLLEFQDFDIPEGYDQRPALRMSVVGPIETVFKRGFLNLVMLMVERNVPLFLCMRGPPGFYPVNSFLNDALKEAVAAKDMRAVAVTLGGMLQDLANVEYQPAKYEHLSAPDFSISLGDVQRPG
jgi:hypothetical protein